SSLLRIRPPPESTLFPYTTLFRSHKKPQGEGATPMSVQRPSPPANADIEITAELPVLDVAAYEAAASGRPGASSDTWIIPPQPRDRKSTRLNSSHRTISYAVFCLK